MSKTIGKLREYETVLIINPDLTDDVANELIERFKGIIDAKGGTFLREDRWGKRKNAEKARQEAARAEAEAAERAEAEAEAPQA